MRLALLMHNDPYFFPGYLELLSLAHHKENSLLYWDIVREAFHAVHSLAASKVLQQACAAQWTTEELQAMQTLVHIGTTDGRCSILSRHLIRGLGWFLGHAVQPLIQISVYDPRYVVSQDVAIDTTPLIGEVRTLEPYWWLTEHVAEQGAKVAGVYALPLLLGAERASGAHTTPLIDLLPRVFTAVQQAVKTSNITLASMKVRMIHHSIRHHAEWWGPTQSDTSMRYWLILATGAKTEITAGDERVAVLKGQWLRIESPTLLHIHKSTDQPFIFVECTLSVDNKKDRL